MVWGSGLTLKAADSTSGQCGDICSCASGCVCFLVSSRSCLAHTYLDWVLLFGAVLLGGSHLNSMALQQGCGNGGWYVTCMQINLLEL